MGARKLDWLAATRRQYYNYSLAFRLLATEATLHFRDLSSWSLLALVGQTCYNPAVQKAGVNTAWR